MYYTKAFLQKFIVNVQEMNFLNAKTHTAVNVPLEDNLINILYSKIIVLDIKVRGKVIK